MPACCFSTRLRRRSSGVPRYVFSGAARRHGVCIILGYLVARLLRLPRSAVGAFVQGAIGNLAYVGLPRGPALSAPTPSPWPAPSAGHLALAFLIPVYNLLAVAVLLADDPRNGSGPRILQMSPRWPPIRSCSPCCRPALRAFEWKLPPVIRRTCATLGHGHPIGVPQHRRVSDAKALRDHFCACRRGAADQGRRRPLAGYLVARWLGLSPVESRVA